MIGRFWRGWATTQQAQAYEELFRTSILPGLRHIEGFAGAYVLRRDADGGGRSESERGDEDSDGDRGGNTDGDEVELMTFTLFESPQAVRAFAGADPDAAHVTPEARQLLSRFEHTVTHYEVRVAPQ